MMRHFLIATICFLVVAALASKPARSETVDDAGFWTALFANGDFFEPGTRGERWRWWFDGHARFLDDAEGFNQSIVRPGIGYSLTDRATLWAGYGWIRTSPLTAGDFDEHRIWQQITWSQTCGDFTFALRPRLEQRFIETGSDTGWRFRQFLRAHRPLPNHPRLTFVLWDEVFFHLNDTDWGARAGFNQNRVFVGGGFKCDPDSPWRVEVGYLNQAIHIPAGDDRSNHILAVNFFFSP